MSSEEWYNFDRLKFPWNPGESSLKVLSNTKEMNSLPVKQL